MKIKASEKLALAMWLMTGIFGMSLSFVGGFLFGGLPGAMVGLFSCFLAFFPCMRMFGVAKEKNFLPLFIPLKDKQKYVHFPDDFGKIHTLIMDIAHKGTLYLKGWGFVDDKGTEYAWGGDPCVWAEPDSGYTYDVTVAQYTSILSRDEGIENYDQAIKIYLGDLKYRDFCNKFRTNPKPDIYDIYAEIDYLESIATPNNKLEKIVFGHTYGFKQFLPWMRYNYNPQALVNAIDTEKIWVKKEMEGYREPGRAMGIAKAVALLLFVVMIIVIVLSTVDLSGFMNLFKVGGVP